MASFLPDLAIAVIGAALGGAFTAWIAYGTYVIERRRIEAKVLNELMLELSERRAFRVDDPVEAPRAREDEDLDRLSKSVADARESIRKARSELGRDPESQASLSEMIRSCNRFLEDSAWKPERYQFDVVTLRMELHDSLRAIASRRGFDVVRPGDLAFEGPDRSA